MAQAISRILAKNSKKIGFFFVLKFKEQTLQTGLEWFYCVI